MTPILMPTPNFQIPPAHKIDHVAETLAVAREAPHAGGFQVRGECGGSLEHAAAIGAAELKAVVVLADVLPDGVFLGDGGET